MATILDSVVFNRRKRYVIIYFLPTGHFPQKIQSQFVAFHLETPRHVAIFCQVIREGSRTMIVEQKMLDVE